MKKALIIIGVVLAIILAVSGFLPNTAHVERSIEINAPIDVVFDQVSNLELNRNWSPWVEKDPDMEIIYDEVVEGLGAGYSWSGNKDVGSGTIKTVEWAENEKIVNEIVFAESRISKGTWTFEEFFKEDVSDGSLVQTVLVVWSLDAELSWPINRFFGLGFESMVGPNFERGLQKLKEVSESMPRTPRMIVQEESFESMRYVGVRDSLPIAELDLHMGTMFGEVIAVLEENEITIDTPPICIYYDWNEEEGYTLMEAAIVIGPDVEIQESGRVKMGEVAAGQVAKVVYTGPYDELNMAHFAVDQWLKDNNREMAGPCWEKYITDPAQEPDSSKWVTEVYYSIQ